MKHIWVSLCVVILFLISSHTVKAKEFIPEKEPLQIVFVIDASGSMKVNDPSGIGLCMVQAFVDTVQAEDIRIGYVAYNDDIISYAAPDSIATAEKREELKREIGSIPYAGDTDIGRGVTYAYDLMSAAGDGRKIIVLISDGETDLPGNSGRTEEQSNRELAECVSQCREEGIQIYTVAFGQYDGSEVFLKEISEETGAESYSAQSPENLIEVLYGIFQDNLFYRIQRFSSGTYAGGSQNITCILDAAYLDEIDILLLSNRAVGESTVRNGEKEFALTNLSHYAAGKIESGEIDPSAKELLIHTVTEEGQDLQIYVISYRNLIPVLEITPDAARNQELPYQVYFKDQNGNVVSDAGFYESFSLELSCVGSDMVQDGVRIEEARVQDGVFRGQLCFPHSGTYLLNGALSDDFGSYIFTGQIEVFNAIPQGSIPEEACTLLERERTICLDDYFTDENGDVLFYSLPAGQGESVSAQLDGGVLTLTAQSTGTHMVILQVSDGEDTIQYVYRMQVLPLWQAYWWVIVLALLAAAAIAWILTHRPKPELERLTEEKKENHFCGKLDAYFIRQPEDEEEIPPLSVQMSRIKDGRVTLGDLFGAYPKQAEALQLSNIYLIADELRSIILYHTSMSGIMVGNGIVCKQVQYSIGFGDIVYITSPDGRYDLEIHYIAVFQ